MSSQQKQNHKTISMQSPTIIIILAVTIAETDGPDKHGDSLTIINFSIFGNEI